MKKILALLTVLLFCTPSGAQEMSVETLLAQSQPTIQATLGTVADALNQSSRDPQDNIDARRIVGNLKEATSDKHEIVKQVAIFAAASGEQQPLVALAVLQLLDLPPSIVIEVLAPYLNADHIKVRSFVLDWFQSHDNGGSDESPFKPVNFVDYAGYVRRKLGQNENLPAGFVEYLFERSPGQALLVFNHADRRGETVDRLQAMRRELEQQGNIGQNKLPPAKEGLGRSDILLAEHIVSNAIWLKENGFAERFQKALPEANAELAKLAKHDKWWARLYVAGLMRRHQELRQPDILRQLSEDNNALVRKAAKSSKDR